MMREGYSLWIYVLLLFCLYVSALEKRERVLPMVDVDEVMKGLDGKVWVVSTGGVGSEYLRSLIVDYGNQMFRIPHHSVGRLKKKRPFHGVVAHYPYPVLFSLCGELTV